MTMIMLEQVVMAGCAEHCILTLDPRMRYALVVRPTHSVQHPPELTYAAVALVSAT